MRPFVTCLIARLLPCALCIAQPVFAAPLAATATADDEVVSASLLDRYTAQRDESFSFELVKTYDDRPGFVGYAVKLVSQTWRSADEVSHPQWTHMLQIVRPERVTHDTALLLIAGGRRMEQAPQQIEEALYMMAQLTQSVVVAVPNVPNQPLELNGDGEKRYEDDLLAETWMQAFAAGDMSWVVHLAMVESAVAAMDAAQQFLASEAGGEVAIERFVVSGGSKRGWTTWLTGAVDERVVAIVPIVIDAINLPAMMRHHWGAYGFWAPAIGDYASRSLYRMLESPQSYALRSIVDPYLYRNRYDMPKFLLNSAGDQYFLPDTTRYYLHDFPGLTRLRVVPNTNHSLSRHIDAVQSALGFYVAVVHGREIPSLREAYDTAEPGVLRIQPSAQPYEVTLWQAYNAAARDFRQEEVGNIWESTPLEADAGGAYTACVEVPERGYRAFFIEARFRLEGQDLPLTFTTQVQVVPDVLPFADKAME